MFFRQILWSVKSRDFNFIRLPHVGEQIAKRCRVNRSTQLQFRAHFVQYFLKL